MLAFYELHAVIVGVPLERSAPLNEIVRALSGVQVESNDPAAIVRGIRYDSRLVRPGDVFVAVPGFHVDGHSYVAQAIRQDATAVVVQADHRYIWQPQVAGSPGTSVLVVDDTRAALARAAAAFFGWPARKLRVIGITGTDGKTTTSYLASAVLESAGYRTGMIGTVDFKIGERVWSNDSRQTTPESPEVQELLAEMVESGVDYAIIESTSHGLELRRLDCCEYDVAVLTNITSDHLDFHETREAYVAAKARLFAMLDEGAGKGAAKWAVLNADDPASAVMRAATSRALVLTYALSSPADLSARDIVATEHGSDFVVAYDDEAVPASLALPGRFNIVNALAATAVGLTQGMSLIDAARGVSSLEGVPGRMERIDAGFAERGFAVIVDYAHTEPALRKVLQELRASASGRLILVFGAAGGRDKARRDGLGRAAAELADRFFITNEDPREEDPEAIIADIADAARRAGRSERADFVRVSDRRQAIRQAIQEAEPGDVVLIAGKGHEGSIIIGREKRPWDDRQVAREALAQRFGTMY